MIVINYRNLTYASISLDAFRLLLGPPRSGKTTFVLMLAGRLDKSLKVVKKIECYTILLCNTPFLCTKNSGYSLSFPHLIKEIYFARLMHKKCAASKLGTFL